MTKDKNHYVEIVLYTQHGSFRMDTVEGFKNLERTATLADDIYEINRQWISYPNHISGKLVLSPEERKWRDEMVAKTVSFKVQKKPYATVNTLVSFMHTWVHKAIEAEGPKQDVFWTGCDVRPNDIRYVLNHIADFLKPLKANTKLKLQLFDNKWNIEIDENNYLGSGAVEVFARYPFETQYCLTE